MSASNKSLVLGTSTDIHGKSIRRWMTPEDAARQNKKRKSIERMRGNGWKTGTAPAAPASRAAVVNSAPTPSKPFSALVALASSSAMSERAEEYLDRVRRAFDPDSTDWEFKRTSPKIVMELSDLAAADREAVLSRSDLPDEFCLAALNSGDADVQRNLAVNESIPFSARAGRYSYRGHEQARFETLREHYYEELAAESKDSGFEWYTDDQKNTVHVLTGTDRNPDGFGRDGFNDEGIDARGADRDGVMADGSVAPLSDEPRELARSTRDIRVQQALLEAGHALDLIHNENLEPEVADGVAVFASKHEDGGEAKILLNGILKTGKVSKESLHGIIENTAKEVPENGTKYGMADTPPRSIRVLSVLHHSKSVDVGTKRKVNAVLREKGWLE